MKSLFLKNPRRRKFKFCSSFNKLSDFPTFAIPLPKVQGLPLSPSRGPKGFLELFSGKGGLTAAFSKHGFFCFPGIDILNGPENDLTNPRIQKFILDFLASGAVWYCHLGAPCSIWSQARRNIKNLRKAAFKERVGVELAIFSVKVAKFCQKLGIYYSIENPSRSKLWDSNPMLSLHTDRHSYFLEFHTCGYGASCKKQTKIFTNLPGLFVLSRFCTRDHKHDHLQGKVRIANKHGQAWINRTALAGSYPMQLCKAWARAALQFVPDTETGQCKQLLSHFCDGLRSSHVRRSEGATDQSSSSKTTYLREADRFLDRHKVFFGGSRVNEPSLSPVQGCSQGGTEEK